MKTVLILSNADDHATNKIIKSLGEFNQKYLCLYPDQFSALDIGINLNLYNSSESFVFFNGQRLYVEEIASILYRRPIWLNHENATNRVEKFSQKEWKSSFWSLITSCSNYWVNHPFYGNSLLEGNKFYQMRIASQAGLVTPDTIISNSYDEVYSFCEKYGSVVACKTINNYPMFEENGVTYGLYTQLITLKQLEANKNNIVRSPLMVQEYIEKETEIRITIIGSNLFACRIYSQDSQRTQHDWRRYDFEKVRHEEYNLPAELKKRLYLFMNLAHLNFGAVDMILRPDGTYVFLEVNPSGQYGWIESLTKMPISWAFAQSLMNPAENGLKKISV